MATWLNATTGLIAEHHLGADSAASLLNHATGTTVAALIGTPTYGTGYMDISGAGGSPKGMDLGYACTSEDYTFMCGFDPSGSVDLLAAGGTNELIKARARMAFDLAGTAGDAFAINGTTVTLVTSGATGNQINVGATPQLTAANAATLINGNPGVFGVTADCPAGNSVIELTAVSGGTAGNSIALSESSSAIRFVVAGGAAGSGSAASALAGGTNGESTQAGLFVSGANLQCRNDNIGGNNTGIIATPGGSDYYFIAGRARRFDFPELLLYTGSTLNTRNVGSAAGRASRSGANFQIARSGGGTGGAKMAFCAVFSRLLSDAEILADFISVKTEMQSLGLTVN